MALSVPKSGYARFLKEGAQQFKGLEEAVYRSIEACVELAAQVRSSFGPNGMNKMVISNIEKLFVTSDAATILKELDVQHPAARILVMASQMQEKQIGDGTNAVIIIAAALLEHAGNLLRMGLSATEVAEGYEQALESALKILETLVVKRAKDIDNLEALVEYLKSPIMSKQFDNYAVITEQVAKACLQVSPSSAGDFNVDNVRVCKVLGSGVSDMRLMSGMVFRRGAEGDVKHAENARIAVFACPFDLSQTETKGTVLMETAEDMLSYSAQEEAQVEAVVRALKANGVSVVVAVGRFGDLFVHFLNKYAIMGVRLTSKFDLRRLCRTVRAQAQARICAPTAEFLGVCGEVYVSEIGDVEVVVFDNRGAEKCAVATIIVRGSSQSILDDIERAIEDGINTFKALKKDNRLLAGAGAVETEVARQIASLGEKCPGLEQYAFMSFAHSLETIPRLLAENGGYKPTEVLSKLHASHEAKNATAGVGVEGGPLVLADEASIYDLYSAKVLAFKLATDAAVTILKTDQIIMSKPASGGPAPRGPKPQDADDDAGMA